MSKRKRKNDHEEHVDETWLIPYADMLTLLLALFIVLFAASSVDAQKLEKIADSLRYALTGGAGVMEHYAPNPAIETTDSPPKEAPPEDEEEDNYEELEELFTNKQDLVELMELQKRINQYIEDKDLQLSLQTSLTKEGLRITIMDNALFSSGSATIRPDAHQLAREISHLLVTDPPRQVEIAGHTDNDPIHTPQFRSNWDLSAMRAINFLKLLLENTDLEPNRFSATGYGEFNPVAENETEEGKAKNRRVEVLILPYD